MMHALTDRYSPVSVVRSHVSQACCLRTAGESLPINGTVDPTDENYLETHNVGLQGTHCVSGSVTGIVVSTGDATVFGRIAKLTSEPKTGLTTLEKEVLRFVALIVLIMLTMIIVIIIVW